MPPKFSEQELELLTEEERDGLLNEDDIDEGDETGGDDDDDTGGSDGDDDDDGAADAAAKAEADKAAADKEAADAAAAAEKAAGDDPAAAAAKAKAESDKAAADKAAADAAAAGAGADEETTADVRPPKWRIPADTDDKLKTLADQLDELAEKFDDGDLGAKELLQQQRAIQNQIDELNKTKLKAELALNTAQDTWIEQTVPEFFGDPAHKQYAVKDGFLYKALDAEVRKLQAEAVNPYDPNILKKAHKAVQAELAAALGGEVPKPPKPDPAAKGGDKPRREVPPSLAHVPASDIQETDGSDFAYLDRLSETDPLKYEETLAKMPEAERERYLAM